MEPYARELSWTERSFVARRGLQPPSIVQLVVEGMGNPTPEALRAALERTSRANPGSCLVLDESAPALIWRVGAPPELTTVDAPEFDTSSDAGAPLVSSPLGSGTSPSCGLLFVRSNHHSYLIFRSQHEVMDGHGTLSWARDFMRCLRGEEPVGHPSAVTTDQLLKDIGEPRRAHPLPDALHPFGPANRAESRGRFHWRRMTVGRPLDAKMSGRIAVAIANRARAHGGDGVVRLNVPADLRHYRPNDRIMGNFFSSLHIEVPSDASADDVSFRIVQALYRHEPVKAEGLYASESPGSLAAFRVKSFFDLARLDDSGRYQYSATLSNLGLLGSADLSAPSFLATAAFFVPLENDSGCTVTLNGFDKHTEAAVGLSDRFAGDSNLDAFTDLVRGALEVSAKRTSNTSE